jgi:hypothetical protein
MIQAEQLCVKVDSPIISPSAHNFRPTCWPPPPDFPVVVDGSGRIVSRYSDPIWNVSCWAGRPTVINFGDGPKPKGNSSRSLTPSNAGLLRCIVCWWLYAEKGLYGISAYIGRFDALRPVFFLCNDRGILASDLHRYPLVQDELPGVLIPSSASKALALLHSLYEAREDLGFMLLDREGLRRLEAALPTYENRQTPYIPPRIWNYQATRLREFLEEFLAHRDEIEQCYRFCIEAYAQNYGSVPAACEPHKDVSRCPFLPSSRALTGARYVGSFGEVAEQFGVSQLLERWCGSLDRRTAVRVLTSYLDSVGDVAVTYLMSFSLMRMAEAGALRADCLQVEQDETFGPIYLLRGETTKTVQDDDARWVTSASTGIAVEAASAAVRLRLTTAKANPATEITEDEERNPYLLIRSYEPWSSTVRRGADPSPFKREPHNYETNLGAVPNLFDPEQLRITESDLKVARLITPSLDPDRFAVGKIWPLANHQLRRTGAVNMQASGLVSDSSAQYQLKHATRARSLYYGQGRSRLRLNDSARDEIIRTMYEVMSKEIAHLFTDRFVSPLGEDHKLRKLQLIDPEDSRKLTKATRAGRISYRETLLGGCMKRGSCPFGGIDNIIHCGGGDAGTPCADALYDRAKTAKIVKLAELIAANLREAPENSPLRESLEAQQRSVTNALNVLAA